MEKSHISLEAGLSKAVIQSSIEKELKKIIGTDGITLRLPQGELLIESIENIQYKVNSSDIQLAADIEVEYHKEEGINVAGQATIHLVFNINYRIQPDFTLKTNTRLAKHEWIEKPRVKVGKLSIPTKGALDLLINTFDDQLGKKIDEVIEQKLDLQKVVTEQLTKLENPIPNPLDPNIHLFVKPYDLLFNITEKEDDYNLAAHISLDAKVTWERQTAGKIFSSLPNIEEYDGTTTSSLLHIPVKVHYRALADFLEKQFANVTVLGRQLEVKQLTLGYDGWLNIKALINGDFSGTLQAKAKPRLDVASQTLHLEDLTYDLSTSNFLVKAAVFLFKGEIDKRLDQFSKVPLKPIVNPLIKDLNSKLANFKLEGLEFRLQLSDLSFLSLALQSDHLITEVEIKANQAIV